MKHSTVVLTVLTAILTFGFVAKAEAPKLTFKFTAVNVKGAQDTRVFGTNKPGVLVGWYIDSAGNSHGMMIKGKTVTTIDNPKGTNTQGVGINLAGDIVGFYTNSAGVTL